VRSIVRRSLDAADPERVAARAISRRRPPRDGEKTRNRGEVGRAGTHLLPWGCQTIMELVLAALPVETAGALLRTGATAERAAILTVEGGWCVLCTCGYVT
jgi:hypothetical protein